MSKSRPMAYCTADGCGRRTRAASKQCSQHRTSAVPVITVNDAGFLDIHGIMHSPTEALELANKIADVLAGGRRGRH
ncbi:hypothetical protein [Gordonia humi]|uniref:Uncharacterized protein n=1 Tax=Gordonia humi TaxID=686429 RepID=A0A840F0C5_9ACTN|nr:hypothetical protein [Gordonia humi]MBB4134739.1 hypothetical protein [Gordonia humi]